MMLSPIAKRNIGRILPFALIWLFFAIVYSLMERGLMGNANTYPATGNPYHFGHTFFITAITALVAGSIIGTIEIFYINRFFQRKSFVKKIIYKTFIYFGIIVLFLLSLTLLFNSIELKMGIFSSVVLNNVKVFFFNYAFWGVSVYIAAVIGVSLFYTEVSENLGPAVLNNFFTGKYHTPGVEERIFMFLDMRSSTTIAEQIGHVRYFEMLKEYFADMSAAIVRHGGEIYQYVGDEIVVSWKMKKGLKNNNCISCFYAIRAAIAKQEKKYHTRFGVFPEFKAGFHFGKVTSGEIGVLKKEIIFTGDVLNTTARIQSLCNQYDADLLLSGPLLDRLNLSGSYTVTALGENELRGRDEKIGLFKIIPSS